MSDAHMPTSYNVYSFCGCAPPNQCVDNNCFMIVFATLSFGLSFGVALIRRGRLWLYRLFVDTAGALLGGSLVHVVAVSGPILRFETTPNKSYFSA